MTTDHPTNGSPADHGLDILIVDDEPDTRTTFSILLRLAGHEVQVAPNGTTALGLIEKRRPDVILLDIGLPRMDGFEVCRRIRQRFSGRPPFVIAVTGFTDDDHQHKATLAGIDLYLLKPMAFPALEKVLQRFQQAVKTTERVTTEKPGQCPTHRASV